MTTDQQTTSSYREALKATSVTGTSTVIEVGVKIIKSKVIAVCVGPEGVGLFSILTAATTLIGMLSNLGVSTSGVRQVAVASGTDDHLKIARVIHTLRRTSLVCGLLGMLVIVVLAKPISRLTTGSGANAGYLVLLGPLILLQNINSGQTAMLRGLRRIVELAHLRVIAAVAATLFSVPLVLAYGVNGIVPAMLMTSLASVAVSWWYARQVKVPALEMPFREVWSEARALFGLGVTFLFAGLLGPIIDNALRSILVHITDLYTVGQFSAAYALSHVYVNFILQSMGLDYLPRLSKHKNNITRCNEMVNEQTEIALLLAAPGVTALVVLAPVLLPVFYSSRFAEAVDVFRWQCLGVLLKVASWPIGFVLIALGLRTAYLLTETVTSIVYVGAFYVLVQKYALTGAALTFAVVYIWYLPLIFVAVRRATRFSWSPSARRIFLAALGSYTGAMVTSSFTFSGWSFAAGLIVVTTTSLWAYRELCRRAHMRLFHTGIRWCKQRLQGAFRS